MALLFFLLLASSARAQTGDTARTLLEEVASTSQSATSWLADGAQVIDTAGRGMPHYHDEGHFKVAYQNPSRMFVEMSAQETVGDGHSSSIGALMVCDGTDHWMHYSPGASFYRSSALDGGRCKPEIGDFSKIAVDLLSAVVIGRDRLQFADAAAECELVRAEYAVPSAPTPPASQSHAPHFTRTFCIDPARKLILRDRVEKIGVDASIIQTTTYARFRRDAAIPADLFQFRVPTGYFEDDGPQSASPPSLISAVEPSYTPDALQAGISGIVLVSLRVSPQGEPEEVKVVRGLGHGLDEKAVQAVRHWHFHPGTRNDVPVAVESLKVAVGFRRP